jgi:hypothetical protein
MCSGKDVLIVSYQVQKLEGQRLLRAKSIDFIQNEKAGLRQRIHEDKFSLSQLLKTAVTGLIGDRPSLPFAKTKNGLDNSLSVDPPHH